ncbi:tetratricopeptide repeat protein, partial [bacterium]|nr:tetratricopeptide repeat protein [bacterium]
LRQGQIDEALRHALRAVAIGTPHAAHYHDTLGRVLLRLGRAAEAADAFRAAIKASGNDTATRDEARRGLAEAQRQAQQQGKPPAP